MNRMLSNDAAIRSFCTFRLGMRLYGIEVAQIREVSLSLPITPVPQTPPAVRGLFNLRSRIYLALDLRPLLGLPPADCSAESRFIILKPSIAQDVGILVDQGGDIVHTTSDLIEAAGGAADALADSDSPFIAGICKLPSELMMIVDLTRITEIIVKLFL